MLKYLLFLMCFPLMAADVSNYSNQGPIETLPGFTDLSDAVWIDGLGPAYVDNNAGRLDLPNGMDSCFPGGDVEGVANYVPGKLYTLNEAKNGIRIVNYANCDFERKFTTTIDSSGSNGLEGITTKDGVVYLLEELTGNVYSFVDYGGTSQVDPAYLFTIDCEGAGGLTFNGNNLLAVCHPPSPTVVEYDLSGGFVSQLNLTGMINPEGIYFNNVGDLCVVGEPDLSTCSSLDDIIDPPPDETETCTYSGVVDVDINTGAFNAQTVVFDCPTITASGTLQ